MGTLAASDLVESLKALTPILIALFGTIGGIYLRKLDLKAAEAKKAVVEVKATLEDANEERKAVEQETVAKIDGLKVVGDKTHALVNSAMTTQLKTNAMLSARLAAISKDPEDIKIAEAAQKLLEEHLAEKIIQVVVQPASTADVATENKGEEKIK